MTGESVERRSARKRRIARTNARSIGAVRADDPLIHPRGPPGGPTCRLDELIFGSYLL